MVKWSQHTCQCSHIISQSAQIERVAVTHHVSHACDSAKLPVGSMTCPPCSLHGRVIRVCPIARMYASVTVLGRWDRFHSLPPAATPGTFMCCHGACRCPLTWPPCSLHGRVIRVCPIARMYASVRVLIEPSCVCHSCVCVPSPWCTRVHDVRGCDMHSKCAIRVRVPSPWCTRVCHA